jgi:hypothetical protein
MVRYLLAWLPMVVLAVANGALREAWLVPFLGAEKARQVSTLILIALFAIYLAIVFRIWPIGSARDAVLLGLAWLVLTLAFEFLLGFYASHLTLRQMLAEYNLAAGRLWALVPLWVAIAPYFIFRLHR